MKFNSERYGDCGLTMKMNCSHIDVQIILEYGEAIEIMVGDIDLSPIDDILHVLFVHDGENFHTLYAVMLEAQDQYDYHMAEIEQEEQEAEDMYAELSSPGRTGRI